MVARDAGFIPSQDTIVLEEGKPGENPYINVIVARTEDKDKYISIKVPNILYCQIYKGIIMKDIDKCRNFVV